MFTFEKAPLSSAGNPEKSRIGTACFGMGDRGRKGRKEGLMQIREATREDAAKIAALHIASWRDAYRAILRPDFLAGPIEAERRAVWTERMARPQPNQQVLLAEHAGKLLGFICAFEDEDPIWGTFIDNLHVSLEARGQGLGTGLLRAIASRSLHSGGAGAVYLWVYEKNQSARHFYERLGARAVEREVEAIPGGGTAPAIRMHWPDAGSLLG
jgi:GNAT superfamily N-acetyltransferase